MDEYVYIVGISDCEDCSIYYVCKKYETALKKWNFLRNEIIKENNKKMSSNSEITEKDIKMYERMNKNLSNTDPQTLCNFPHEEPFILKKKLED